MRRNVWFANVKSTITEGSGRLHRGGTAGKLLWQMCDVIWVPLSAAHTHVFLANVKYDIWYIMEEELLMWEMWVLYLMKQIWFWSCSMFVCYSHKYVIRKCEIWDQGRKRAVCRESWCDESEIRCPPSVSYALPLFLTVSTLQQIFSSIFFLSKLLSNPSPYHLFVIFCIYILLCGLHFNFLANPK